MEQLILGIALAFVFTDLVLDRSILRVAWDKIYKYLEPSEQT